MPKISIDLPDSLFLSKATSFEEIKKESLFAVASYLFQKGYLSSGVAAEMCGDNRVDFILKLGRSGIPVADLDGEELDEEFSNE
jgi:predicted HTH domain antitoxin